MARSASLQGSSRSYLSESAGCRRGGSIIQKSASAGRSAPAAARSDHAPMRTALPPRACAALKASMAACGSASASARAAR